MIVMVTTRSFLAFTLFRATFESNYLNFSVLCVLFCTYWVSILTTASKSSQTSIAEWFTLSNVLSFMTTICVSIVFNRAVGSGFVEFLDDSLSENFEDLAGTLDMIDDPVIVINHVADKEANNSSALLYANNQFSGKFSTSLKELRHSHMTNKKLRSKRLTSTSSWLSFLEEKIEIQEDEAR